MADDNNNNDDVDDDDAAAAAAAPPSVVIFDALLSSPGTGGLGPLSYSSNLCVDFFVCWLIPTTVNVCRVYACLYLVFHNSCIINCNVFEHLQRRFIATPCIVY